MCCQLLKLNIKLNVKIFFYVISGRRAEESKTSLKLKLYATLMDSQMRQPSPIPRIGPPLHGFFNLIADVFFTLNFTHYTPVHCEGFFNMTWKNTAFEQILKSHQLLKLYISKRQCYSINFIIFSTVQIC